MVLRFGLCAVPSELTAFGRLSVRRPIGCSGAPTPGSSHGSLRASQGVSRCEVKRRSAKRPLGLGRTSRDRPQDDATRVRGDLAGSVCLALSLSPTRLGGRPATAAVLRERRRGSVDRRPRGPEAGERRRALGRLVGLAREAHLRDPDGLAAQLLLLMDGAWVAARMFGPENHATAVGEAARALIGAHSTAGSGVRP